MTTKYYITRQVKTSKVREATGLTKSTGVGHATELVIEQKHAERDCVANVG